MAGTWSELDEATLQRMFAEGATTKDVAVALGRTQEAVSGRRLMLIRRSAAGREAAETSC